VATAAPGRATLLSTTRRDPSIRLPSPVYTAATAWRSHCHWSAQEPTGAGANSHGVSKNCSTPGTLPAAIDLQKMNWKFHTPSDYVVTTGASTGRGNLTPDSRYLSDGRLCNSSENRVNNINMLEVYHEIRGNLGFFINRRAEYSGGNPAPGQGCERGF
jgi:hypothetical protein